jgi:hypothetical protein
MPSTVVLPVEIDTVLRDVVLTWNLLRNTMLQGEAVKRYNRLLSLQTNQLEGLFRLHDAVNLQ